MANPKSSLWLAYVMIVKSDDYYIIYYYHYCINCLEFNPQGPLLHTPHAQVKHVLRHSSVQIAEFDQCQFGLKSLQSKTPVKKRTRIMTNSGHLMNALNGKFCPGDHIHQVVSGSEGGMKRSQAAQIYPDPLVHSICEALLAEEASRSK